MSFVTLIGAVKCIALKLIFIAASLAVECFNM